MLVKKSAASIKHIFKALLTVGLIVSAPISFAATGDSSENNTAMKNSSPAAVAPNVTSFDEEAIKKAIYNKIGLTVLKASPSPMPGLAEIITQQGLFYTTLDGNFLIQGTMLGLGTEKVTNLTEVTMSKMRLEGLKQFENDTIVYKAKNEKHVVNVFTDITCGYCRQMHQQMDKYNELGITVRYLPYPREGIMDRAGRFTEGFQNLRSIWCHEDPEMALTKAKAGQGVAHRICNKPIAEEFEFARQIGINATPAIILANGNLRPGYLPPETLIELLESM